MRPEEKERPGQGPPKGRPGTQQASQPHANGVDGRISGSRGGRTLIEMTGATWAAVVAVSEESQP